MIKQKASVVIVSYNTVRLLKICLDSVMKQGDSVGKIVVVDNASIDGSQQMVHHKYPSVHLIECKENLGFAKANNLALHLCDEKYICFLNPDAQFTGLALEIAIAYMENHPSIGIAGTKLIYPDGSPQWSVSYSYPHQNRTKNFSANLSGNIAAVMGASMIAKKSIVENLNGFDEDFFLYGEEQDLCLRVRKLGFEVGYIESATVIHHEGQSEIGVPKIEMWQRKSRAEILFCKKHYGEVILRRIMIVEKTKAILRLLMLNVCQKTPAIKTKMAKYEAILSVIDEQKNEMGISNETLSLIHI